MGKSNKNIKSDRINTLRKKYDAFLEEDKKRKERNEYILGRLDKMRYRTALIKLRHKPVYKDISLPTVYNRIEYQPDTCVGQLARPDQQLLPLDVIRRPADDILLIKEMSKRYILIPKIRSNLTKDYIEATPTQIFQSNPQPETVSDDGDWKSKYDILEQLKESEKEDKTKVSTGIDDNHIRSELEKTNLNTDENKVTKYCGLLKYDDKMGESSIKYKSELSEKDLTDREILVDYKPQKSEIYEMNKIPMTTPDDDYQGEQNGTSMVELAIVDSSETKCQNANIKYRGPPLEKCIKGDENDTWHPETESKFNTEYIIEENVEKDNTNGKNKYPQNYERTEYEINEHKDKDKSQDTEKEVYLDEDGICPIQVINPSDLVEEINNTAPTEDTEDLENMEYPIELINSQEFTPNDDVKLQDDVNINPEGHIINSNESYVESAYQLNPQTVTVAEAELIEDPADTSGIEAFDAEQQEMFYSESVDENYAYNQEGAETYNPEFVSNDNYQKNEEYVYYEGTQDEQYPVDINEHEETSKPYDQHYEQQYGNTYEQQEFPQGYDQQLLPPQQMEQIEQPVSYDQNQQEFDQQYEELNKDTGIHVEQDLDNEQGYIEKHDVEDIDAEKPALDKQQIDQVVEQKAS